MFSVALFTVITRKYDGRFFGSFFVAHIIHRHVRRQQKRDKEGNATHNGVYFN